MRTFRTLVGERVCKSHGYMYTLATQAFGPASHICMVYPTLWPTETVYVGSVQYKVVDLTCRVLTSAVRWLQDFLSPPSKSPTHAARLFGLPLPTLLASGRCKCPAGIHDSSYDFPPSCAPLVTAGPSAPTTDTCSAGSTFLLPPEDLLARSPPLPPRRFCGKSVVIQVV